MSVTTAPTACSTSVERPTGRTLVTQTSLYGVFTVLRRTVSVALTPLYTHYLTPHDFGILEVLSLGAWFASIIGICKIDAAFYRYYVAAENPERRSRILSGALLLTLSISTALIGSLALSLPYVRGFLSAGEGIPTDAALIVLGSTWLELATLVPFAYCRATDRVKFIGIVSLLQAVITGTIAPLSVVVLGLGYKGVLTANLLGGLSTAIACVWVLRGERLRITLESTSVLLKYGLPLLPGTLFMYAIGSCDRYFLARFHDLTAVGLYGVAAKFGLAPQMLIMTPFSEMWAANQFKLHAGGMKSLYERASLTYLAILFLCALGIALFTYDFVNLTFGSAYRDVVEIVPFLTFGVAVWGIVPTLDLGSLVAPNKTWIRSLATGAAAIVNLICNVLLIPAHGVFGAAFASIAGFATLAIATAWLNHPLSDMRAPLKRVVVMTTGLAATMMLGHAGQQLAPLQSLIARVACFLGYGGFLYLVAWRGLAEQPVVGLLTPSPAASAGDR